MNINVYLAKGLGWSRRQADRAVKQGHVRINGKKAEAGQKVQPGKDRIIAYGKRVAPPRPSTTIALYKPAGYLSTCHDPRGRKTILHLLPKEFRRLKPVGRLDFDSEGLLLLTDDGHMLLESTHPRYQMEKEYVIRFKKPVTKRLIEKFRKGVELREGIAKADYVEQIDGKEIRVILHQGWNRQLRRMARTCDNSVEQLTRTRSGTTSLKQLGLSEPGSWKNL